MIKFLINFGSFLACIGILAFGGYQTVQELKVEEMMTELESAFESTPLLPQLPGENDVAVTVPAGSSAVLDENTVVEADRVEEELSPSVVEKVGAAVGDDKDADVLVAYDIRLLLDGASIQPGGLVEVTIPAPDNSDEYDSLQVVYIDDEGNVTLCDTTVNADGTVSFVTDHFSRYAVIGINNSGSGESGGNDNTGGNGGSESGKPGTGNNQGGNENEGGNGGSESGKPEDKPTDPDNPGGDNEGGDNNTETPENPGNPGGDDEGGDNNTETPDNPGGDQGSGDGNGSNDGNEGGNDDTPEEPTPAPGLSNEDAKDAFGNMYDSYDPELEEFNKESFMGMISGALGMNNNNNSTPPEDNPGDEPTDEPDFDDIFDGGFGEEFNPDEFIPDEEPEETPDDESDEINDLIVDVAGTYFDKLQEGIKNNQEQNSEASEEEQQAARDEFVEKESEAFAGLLNVVTKPEETTEEELVDSVGAILDSSVCLGTVTESIQKNESLSGTVQEATENLDEQTKAEIEELINSKLEENPENEQNYRDLADLFGIVLGAGNGTLPEIPEGFDPSQIPG